MSEPLEGPLCFPAKEKARGEMENDWGLSAEELDSLEKDALKKVAERQSSSATASASYVSSPQKKPFKKVFVKIFKHSPGKLALEAQYNERLLVVLKSVAGYEWDPIHRNWIYPESQLESLEMALISIKDILSNVHIVPPLSSFLRSTRSESFPGLGTPEERSPAKLPTSQECGCNLSTSPPHPDKREKGSTTPNPKGTISILLYLIEPEKVAARSPYNERIKEAFQAVKGRHWNSEERVWMFPLNSLQEVVDSLIALKSPVVTVETLPPLVLPTLQASTENENAVQYEGQCTAHSSVKASSWKENVVVQEGHGAKDVPKLSITLFLHASTNIAAKFDYHPKLVGAFHMIPRASWHAKERLWMFPVPSLSSAEMILSEIDAVDVEVHKIDPLVRRALDAASAVSDLRDLYNRMPSFIEPKLLPFQRDGVRFLLQHGGRALLADEMGLGKTLQAIAFATCIRESWPVLVLTPSSLRLHWASMIQQWLNISSTDIVVVLSQYGGSNRGGFKVVYSNAKGSIQLDGFFNIISYDLVPKLQSVLLDSKFKTLELVSSLAGYETFDMKAFPFEEIVIADESHFLKNAQAKRTNASLPVLQKAQYVILLSGTPALSRPIELHKQLEALYPDVYRNVHEYGNRYCKGGVFGLYQGASNHEELHNLMKATVMIRRLKKDVLSELPVKRRQQVFLDLDEKDMKQIRALFRELEMVKSNIKVCKSQEDIEALKYSVKHLINKIYNDSAEAKIPAVLDYLGTVVEAGCKFLIFGHHQPMIESIHQFLLKKKVGCIRIDGGTPQSSRQALVTEFQEKDNIRAAVLSIKAGGVGLTLTAASTVIFAELSWTPGDIIQAEDRAHRIGQVQSVNIYYLLANDTVDDIIWDVIQGKLENLGQVLDGQENTLEVSVSQPKSSPAKQTAINMPKSSPAKQTTIDSFLKRCRGANGGKEDGGYPKCKNLRH